MIICRNCQEPSAGYSDGTVTYVMRTRCVPGGMEGDRKSPACVHECPILSSKNAVGTLLFAKKSPFHLRMCKICSNFAADMKNIAFIINPVSGSKETQNAKKKLPKLIMQALDREQWLPNISFTEYAGHATELSRQYARMGFDAVVAVVGD